jgi:hypothetical protein
MRRDALKRVVRKIRCSPIHLFTYFVRGRSTLYLMLRSHHDFRSDDDGMVMVVVMVVVVVVQ